MTGAAAADRGDWRTLAPLALARLLRIIGPGQLELCEDAVSEALLDAHRQWTDGNVPTDPLGWVIAVARRRCIDLMRADRRRRDREERHHLLQRPLAHPAVPATDDGLLVLALCCHPDLPRSGQIALTLRAVAGLSSAQIANAYQVPEATIAQRITRAKRRLDEGGRRLPEPADLAERLDPMLTVLYVMLTESHHTTTGDPANAPDLAAEAIRLTRQLRAALPADTEVAGLLALMLLTQSRQGARIGLGGELIPLDEQNRTRWNGELRDEGLALLDRTVPGAVPGPYLVQACIAGLHAGAASTQDTDWAEIAALYRLLEQLTGHRNPNVELNRIVADAMVGDIPAALAQLDGLAARHPRLPRLAAVRAHLLERDGCHAVEAYREALRATRSVAERDYLLGRLRRLHAVDGSIV